MQFQQVLLPIPVQTAGQAAGSRPFKVNIWMWLYGRVFPRKRFPRKISVEDAEETLWKCVQELRLKGTETLKHRRMIAFARQDK